MDAAKNLEKTTEPAPEPVVRKKPYAPPQIEHFGRISDLTQSAPDVYTTETIAGSYAN